jgi:hypothetical protein
MPLKPCVTYTLFKGVGTTRGKFKIIKIHNFTLMKRMPLLRLNQNVEEHFRVSFKFTTSAVKLLAVA